MTKAEKALFKKDQTKPTVKPRIPCRCVGGPFNEKVIYLHDPVTGTGYFMGGRYLGGVSYSKRIPPVLRWSQSVN